ncbi:winged helix-turn-helix domain-containing protein [Rhodococcus sp. B50]|uniref:winged helix-turn-helix domain-containing protein n=1 Tax=Rhodococcus sp. B50 TaxID=2682847 RepID=UPI001FD18602|nr:winged helix-turn-helix domain-containing protein [Rhodococcus sp. B50]MBS9374284.1 Transcriptional regulator [Rhodococcus sp. B50]
MTGVRTSAVRSPLDFVRAARTGVAHADETMPAGRIMQQLRRCGPATRTVLAECTGLSSSTVNRAVSALLEYGLLRDRPDLAPRGRVGRPHVPVEVDTDQGFLAGIHLGERETWVVSGDLLGRELHRTTFATPASAFDVFAAIGAALRVHEVALQGRRALWAGLAVGGLYDGHRGALDHPRLGWCEAPVDALFRAIVPTPYTVVPYVEAVAEVEYHRFESAFRRRPESWLYLWAEQTISMAWLVDGLARSSADDIESFCAVTGQSSGDDADPSSNRSVLLGRAVALVRDVVNPDVVTVGGDAVTRQGPEREDVSDGYRQRSSYNDVPLLFSEPDDGLRSAAALGAASRVMYVDPIGAMQAR